MIELTQNQILAQSIMNDFNYIGFGNKKVRVLCVERRKPINVYKTETTKDGRVQFHIINNGLKGDGKFYLDQLLDMYVVVYEGWITKPQEIDHKTWDLKIYNPGRQYISENSERNESLFTVFVNKSLREVLAKVGISDAQKLIAECAYRKISKLNSSKNEDGISNSVEGVIDSIYTHLNTMRPEIIERAMGNYNKPLLQLLIMDLKYTLDYADIFKIKEFLDSLFHILSERYKYTNEYTIYALENLAFRYNNIMHFGLGYSILMNVLEKLQDYSSSNDSIYSLDSSNRIKIALINSLNTVVKNEKQLSGLGENHLIAGQSIGNIITSAVTFNTPMAIELNNDGAIINNDNLKVFLFKDISLGLLEVRDMTDKIVDEEMRKDLIERCNILLNKILEARIRIRSKNPEEQMVEFDALDKEIRDVATNIANKNIYDSDYILAQGESKRMYGFGEINPYRVEKKLNNENEMSSQALNKAKEVGTTVYVKAEGAIVTIIKGLFYSVTAIVEESVIGMSEHLHKFFRGFITLLNLGYPELDMGVSPLGLVARQFNPVRKAQRGVVMAKKLRNARERSRARHERMFDLIHGSENIDLLAELHHDYDLKYRSLSFPVGKGESGLINGILAGVKSFNANVIKMVMKKLVDSTNKKLKGKKMTKEAYENSMAKNNEVRKEINRIKDPKEREWATKNLLLDLSTVEVIKPNATPKK